MSTLFIYLNYLMSLFFPPVGLKIASPINV